MWQMSRKNSLHYIGSQACRLNTCTVVKQTGKKDKPVPRGMMAIGGD